MASNASSKEAATWKTYYALTKPGIIYGNDITALGGFFLAARGHVHLILFSGMLVGISLVMASGCVFNNYLDRGIDEKMERTKQRALVRGTVSPPASLIFATLLGLLGTFTLLSLTNPLTTWISLGGLLTYVVVYGIAKRHSVYGTVVGSIAGAVPPVVGYTAVTGRLDSGALLLFLILVTWQMPHFYAIAVYRLSDYRAANLPVWPIVKGARSTKIHILIYVTLFTALTTLLTPFGYAGYAYCVIMALLGLAWLRMGIGGFNQADDTHWARAMFRFSLIVLTSFAVLISLQGFVAGTQK